MKKEKFSRESHLNLKVLVLQCVDVVIYFELFCNMLGKENNIFFMISRIFYFIVFFLSALLLPWWVTVFAGLMGMLLFPLYFEALFVGVFLDALYGGGGLPIFPDFPLVYSVTFAVFFFIFEFLKDKIQYF